MELLELIRELILLVGYVGMPGGFPEQLKPAEEAACIRSMHAGDEGARERLITHNLRLVAHIAKKYIRFGRDTDDVISIGTIGLIKAVSTYQPDKGVPLSSYASRCIENEILMSLRQEKKQVAAISLNESIGTDSEGNDLSFLDVLGSDPELVPDLAERNLERDRMLELVDAVLPEREKRVILLRFGLVTGCPMAQREVAELMGISRSYVSRIEKRAMRLLMQNLKNPL